MDKNLKQEWKVLLGGVLDDVISELLHMLQHQISFMVYEPVPPSRYERTYEFLYSWITTGVGSGKDLKRSIEQDINLMHIRPSMRKEVLEDKNDKGPILLSHGGTESYPEDYRPVMAEYLDKGWFGLNTEANGSYWDEFLSDIDKYLDKIVKDAFRKRGVTVKKVG